MFHIHRVILITLLWINTLHSKEVEVRSFFHFGDEIVFTSMDDEFFFYYTSSEDKEEITDKVLRSAFENITIEFEVDTNHVSLYSNSSWLKSSNHIWNEDTTLNIRGVVKESLNYSVRTTVDSLKYIPTEVVPKLIDGYCGIPWFDRFDELQIVDTIKSKHQFDKTARYLFNYKGIALSYLSRSGVYPEDHFLSYSPNYKSIGDLNINTSYFSVDSIHGFNALSIFLYHKRGYSYSHFVQQLLRDSHNKLKLSVVMMADHQIRFSITHK